LSEEDIVRRLKNERWLYNLLKLKQLDLWQDVYVNPEDSRKADLLGIDSSGKIYAFEVKSEGSNVGAAFDQVCDYCMGANFVYCVLSKESVSAPSKEKLKRTGIGLLLYETKKGMLQKPHREIASVDHDGPFTKNTRTAISGIIGDPRCYIFPARSTNWTKKNIFRAAKKSKFVDYDYDAKRLPTKGSIIVFYDKKQFIGQGTVFESRNATKEDKTSYSYIASLWAETVCEYPKPVSLDAIKDQISVLHRHSGRSLIQVIRNYPTISFMECQRIMQKALEFNGKNT